MSRTQAKRGSSASAASRAWKKSGGMVSVRSASSSSGKMGCRGARTRRGAAGSMTRKKPASNGRTNGRSQFVSIRQHAIYDKIGGEMENNESWGIVGHSWAVSALEHAIRTGRAAHAFLITGTHGIGKTTLARALAKRLLCTAGD